MQNILIAVGIIVAITVVVWFFVRKTDPVMTEEMTKQAMESDEMYQRGMQPAEDGVTFIYALETCRHCRKALELLDENHIQYHLLYVDKYSGLMREALMDKLRSYNPRGSFPTVVIPGGKVVVGFREQLLREALIDDPKSIA